VLAVRWTLIRYRRMLSVGQSFIITINGLFLVCLPHSRSNSSMVRGLINHIILSRFTSLP